MNMRLVNWLYVTSFLSILIVIPVVTLLNTTLSDSNFFMDDSDNSKFYDGFYTKKIEAVLDENLSIHNFSVSAMAAIHYFVFSEAAQGAVIGKDEWIFSNEEIVVPVNEQSNIASNLAKVVAVSQFLRQQDITLVVAPVPAKARVLRRYLSTSWPDQRAQLYRHMMDVLQGEKVHVVDSYQAMRSVTTSESLYFRTDTHWTPEGASLVARATAEYCRTATNVELNTQLFLTQSQAVQFLDGDLMGFVPLSPWFSLWAPLPEPFYGAKTFEQGADLFSASKISTILVGTSYSADQRWNFSGALKQALGRDLASVASKGMGPYQPMFELLETPEILDGIDLVIWEIPERYLMTSYEELEFSDVLKINRNDQVASKI